jgi:AcrR family transcriptional regulator
MARLHDPTLAARRRAQILEAALFCFRRRGFHQATMQEICAEARVSPGAVYRYFKSKADIIAAIAEDEKSRLDALDAAAEAGRGFVEALTEVVRGMYENWLAEENASLVADLLAEAARDPEVGRRVAAGGDMMLEQLAAAIAKAQSQGEIADDLAPAQAARFLIAAIDGIGLREAMRGRDHEAALTDFRTMAERILRPRTRVQGPRGARSRTRVDKELIG